MPPTRRCLQIGAREIRQQQRLQRRPRDLAEPLPLLHGHQHRSLFSAARDDLGSFADTRLQELAEASFSILYRPSLCLHADEHMTSLLTSQKVGNEGAHWTRKSARFRDYGSGYDFVSY